MSVDSYVLAIDHGTSGIKVALLSVYGEVLDFAFAPTPITFLPGGGAEQDPEDWWRALGIACRELMARKAVPREHLSAVSVSSTFSTTVAVDRDGRHLMNALTWMDSRGAPYVRDVVSRWPRVEGYNVHRALKWVRRTGGGPELSGKDDCAHVLFIKHQYPEIYDRTYKFLPSKDWFNLRLTGEFASSVDAMHLFWVTNVRDIDHPRYDRGLIRLMGMDEDKLPALGNSTDRVGSLRDAAADELDLPRNLPVFLGSADHQAALIGSGAVRDYEGHIYIGTSSWVQCIVPFKKTDIAHSIASFPAAIPGRFQSVNEQDIAGGSLGFLVDNLLFSEGGLVSQAQPDDPYAAIDTVAATVPPGSNKVIFTPWLNGERTPVDDTTVRGGIHNLSKTTTQADLVRAFLEGVAYNTRWSLQYVERFAGRRLDPLNLVGGGGKSPLWCRIFADVCDREIRQVRAPMQANARGAAWIAAVGLGEITFDDIPALIAYEQTFSPDPAHRATYDELFDSFVNIYRNNRRLYRRLNNGG